MFPIIQEFSFKKPFHSTFQEASKHAESDRDTHNPTTHKKNINLHSMHPHQQQEQDQNNHHHRHSFKHQHYASQDRTKQQRGRKLRDGRYHSANHQRSHSASFNQTHKRPSTLQRQHRQQRKQVTMAFREQLKVLKESWRHLFDRFREREMKIMICFKALQQKQVGSAKQRLKHRCETQRSPSPSSRMQELYKIQQLMMKMNDFKGLANVKRQMQSEAAVQRRRREEKIERWRKAEEQRLTSNQQKKYCALTVKLDDLRQDKERMYVRDQKKLKQKYKNVIAKMEHCQALDFCLLY